MTFNDILEMTVLFNKNIGDEYYWNYKHIVAYDDTYYVLINEDGSGSGYIDFFVEAIDKEFVDDFMTSRGSDVTNWEKEDGIVEDVIEFYRGLNNDNEPHDFLTDDIVLIPRELVDPYLKKGGYINE